MRWLLGVLLLASPAAAEEAVVVPDHAGDLVPTRFLATVLVEEVHAAGQLRARLGDAGSLRTCEAGRDVCLGLLATETKADVVYLTSVHRSGDEARVLLARYVTAARTVQQRETTVVASIDGLALALRSRVRRFLSGRQIGTRAGALLVRSTPPGAEIVVDGEVVGPAPRIVDGLFVGPHLVEVRQPGESGTTRTTMVAKDTLTEIVVALEAQAPGLPLPGRAALVAGGGAVLLALAGAGFSFATRSAQDDFDALGEPTAANVEELMELRDRGETRATIANAAWGASGAALLAAAWFYLQDVLAARPPEPEEGRTKGASHSTRHGSFPPRRPRPPIRGGKGGGPQAELQGGWVGTKGGGGDAGSALGGAGAAWTPPSHSLALPQGSQRVNWDTPRKKGAGP